MNGRLEVKDLINVGIFTAIYFVCFFATGMIGFIPILFLAIPFLCPVVGGIPMMLYITKINKFGMMTITGIICGFMMFLSGHNIYPVFTAIVCGFLYDLMLRAGGYRSRKLTIIGYGVFSMWLMGTMLPFYVATESYMQMLMEGYGKEYADAMATLTPAWTLPVFVVVSFIGGILGAAIGKSVLKKHFKRAGIV